MRKRSLSTYLFWTNNKLIDIVRTRTKKPKNANKSIRVVDCSDQNNCFLIKSNKQQEKYCVSKAKIFTSGDIELNPGPVNAYMLLQSRLCQHALSILDVGGAGDCFFRVIISHQLYGESSYHMNIHNVGVNYMRNNPERFIESNTEDSWASYLANMSQQGTWVDALVIQAVADAFHVTINIQGSHAPLTSLKILEFQNRNSRP